jgi:hypothetical protein
MTNPIEWLLCKLLPYHDISRKGADGIYLRRWFIWPPNKDMKKLEPRLYLHKFYRGDEDMHMHDHPWPFTSLILTRGYWEETELSSLSQLYTEVDGVFTRHKIVDIEETGEFRRRLFYPRFSLLHRKAEHRHRVVLEGTKPVWTIVRTGSKERSWGFWIKGKLCPWRKYDSEYGICETEVTNTETAVED